MAVPIILRSNYEQGQQLRARDYDANARVTMRAANLVGVGGIEVAHLAHATLVRNASPYRAQRFQLTEALTYPAASDDCPHTEGAQAVQRFRVGGSYQTGNYSANSNRTETLYYPQAYLDGTGAYIGLPILRAGMWVHAAFDRTNGRWEITDDLNQRLYRGKLDGDLSKGGSQDVSVWARNAAGTDVDTSINVTATDWLLGGSNHVESGAKVWIKYSEDDDQWYVVSAEQQQEHQARWIEFVVNDGSGFSTSDSSVTVDGVTYHDGFTPGTAVTTVYNKSASSDYIFEGDDDDKGMAIYDPDTDKYTIYQMECP